MSSGRRARRALRSLYSGGVVYFVLFAALHVLLASTSGGGMTCWDAVGLVLVCAPALAVACGWHPRSRRVTVAIGLCLVAADVVCVTTLPTHGDLGYQAWILGATTFVLLGLAVSRRLAAAWLVYAAMATTVVVWAVVTGQGAGYGAGLVVRHAATLLVGTLFAIGLARSNRTQIRLAAEQQRRRAADRAIEARSVARRAAASDVLEEAGPLLTRIATGPALTAAERREVLVLEGSLRDRIRTPGPLLDGARVAIAAARRRGVEVLLLDEEPGAGDPETRSRAGAWLAAELDTIRAGRFVGRVRPHGTGIRVTAVSDTARRAETFEP